MTNLLRRPARDRSHATRNLALAVTACTLAGVSLATAQTTTVITREPVESRTVIVEQPLALSPAQRTTIYRTARERPIVSAPGTVEYRVGMRVPDTVELYSVPDTVVTEVPAVRSYRYMTVNNRVWLVDPATSQIVAEVAE
jgi:hypothetical protein